MASTVVPEGSWGLPGTPLGMGVVCAHLFSSIFVPNLVPSWLPFGVQFGAILDEFSEGPPGTVPSGLGPDSGASWDLFREPFWVMFGGPCMSAQV